MHLTGWGSLAALTVRPPTPAWVYADQAAHSQQPPQAAPLSGLSYVNRILQSWQPKVMSLGRFGVGNKSVSSGALLQRHGRLTRIESDLRAALTVAADPADGAFAKLLGEAFGTIPGPQQISRLLWKNAPDARTWKKSDAPQVYGAYALSAGLRPPALEAVADAEFVFKEFDTSLLIEVMASDPAGYRRGIEALADEFALWRADLLRVIQQRLLPVAYEYADHVPPVASSPCGVIRMASPEVPRGSLRALQPVVPGPSGASFSWALAA